MQANCAFDPDIEPSSIYMMCVHIIPAAIRYIAISSAQYRAVEYTYQATFFKHSRAQIYISAIYAIYYTPILAMSVNRPYLDTSRTWRYMYNNICTYVRICIRRSSIRLPYIMHNMTILLRYVHSRIENTLYIAQLSKAYGILYLVRRIAACPVLPRDMDYS